MMCFNIFSYNKEIGKPKNLQPLLDGDLQNITHEQFGSANVRVLDYFFKTTTLDQYNKFIEWEKSDMVKYVGDYHDCDDFAFALFGAFCRNPDWSPLAFGYAEGKQGNSYHAYNIFVTNDHTLYVCEPQNDVITTAPNFNGYDIYYVIFG